MTPQITRRATMLGLAGTTLALSAARAAGPIRIGIVNPFSGPMAIYGDEVTRCYQLAIDAANKAGGVAKRQVELVRGDATTPQQGIAAVDQLATRDGVDMFSGTYISAISNSASDAAMQYSKAWWETNALAKELTERGLPNYIRAGCNAAGFATISARAVDGLIAPALKKQPSETTVWIEHEDSIYGSSIAEIQRQQLSAMGVKVVGFGAHSARATDLTDSVLRAKQANPDVWLETGYVSDGNLLLRSARDQGFKPPALLWCGVGDTNDTLDAVGADFAEGMLVVGYARPDVTESYGPGAAAFLAAYRAKYGRDPIAPQGLAGYVGMQMLLEAIGLAGSTDMEQLHEAAARMDRPFNSYATGYGVKFDETFQNTRALPTVVQWQSGKIVTVFPQKAVAAGVGLRNIPRAQG